MPARTTPTQDAAVNDEEILRRQRLHQLAREIVNKIVAGSLDNETATKVADLTLPPLKRQWVRDQVAGIRNSQER